MDRTDYQILNILQRDSRATLKSIGDQVGLTAPAVSERTRRLEEQGIIRAYRIEVDRERLNYNMTGFIQVAPVPEKYNDFCAFCARHPAIIAHYHTIGVFNALLQFAVQGTQELESLLSSIKQYGDSQTSVALKTYFDAKDIPIPGEKWGPPPGRRAPRGAAPRGTVRAPTTQRVRSTLPCPRPGPGGNPPRRC